MAVVSHVPFNATVFAPCWFANRLRNITPVRAGCSLVSLLTTYRAEPLFVEPLVRCLHLVVVGRPISFCLFGATHLWNMASPTCALWNSALNSLLVYNEPCDCFYVPLAPSMRSLRHNILYGNLHRAVLICTTTQIILDINALWTIIPVLSLLTAAAG